MRFEADTTACQRVAQIRSICNERTQGTLVEEDPGSLGTEVSVQCESFADGAWTTLLKWLRRIFGPEVTSMDKRRMNLCQARTTPLSFRPLTCAYAL